MLHSALVFVDAAIEDYQSLANGVAGAKVFVLDALRDGVEQITKILADHRGAASVHILSHGESGALRLGAASLSLETLDRYAEQLQQWKGALADDADLLLYGCRVGAGDRGTQFIRQISRLTAASVAASTTLTGNADLGGNWELDRQVGTVTSLPVLQPDAMAAYASVLVLRLPNLLFGVTNSTDLRVYNVTNGASTSVGTTAFPTFALARQSDTGRLYYVENAQVNPRVAFFDFGTGTNTIVGNTGTPNFLFTKLAQAQNGTIYGFSSNSTDLYAIDPSTGTASVVASVLFDGIANTFGSGDMAFDPANPNRLIISRTRPGDPAQVFRIYSVDIAPLLSGVVVPLAATTIGDVNINGNALSDEGAGSLAFGLDGQVYVTSLPAPGADIQVYRVNLADAAATLVGSTGSTSEVNDFASFPTPTAQIDLVLTKSDGATTIAPGSPITYTIQITNTTVNSDINGINVSDLVSSGITGVNWSAAATGNGTFPTPADAAGTGNINAFFNLGAQSTVVYTLRGVVSPTSAIGSLLSNTATVTLPPGFIDPNPGNNTATDTNTIAVAASLPIALNDTVTTDRNLPVNINVLTNDRDPNNSRLTITGFTRGGNGTVTSNNNGTPNQPGDDFLVYTPNPNFSGTDTFTYTISNASGGSQTATVTVNISAAVPVDSDCVPGINRRSNRRLILGDNDINRLVGLSGNNVLRGFGCPDTLLGGRGKDLLRGGGAADNLQGQQGNDRLNGVTGDDTLNGGFGRDFLIGGLGNDTLRGGRDNDNLRGGSGNDRLIGNLGNDRLAGGAGTDVVQGRLNNDLMFGGGGADQLLGGGGNDRIFGGLGNDFVFGGRRNDRIFGGLGNDQLTGGLGNDLADGGDGADTLSGLRGNDRLFGGSGKDQLTGGAGRDLLNGGSGNDVLFSGRAADTLRGKANNDTLIGGFGGDRLTGGGGADRFVYRDTRDAGDRVTDFDRSAGDRIDLSQLLSQSQYAAANPFTRYVRRIQSGSNTVVQLDFNGDRRGGFQPFITIENTRASTLNARAFII